MKMQPLKNQYKCPPQNLVIWALSQNSSLQNVEKTNICTVAINVIFHCSGNYKNTVHFYNVYMTKGIGIIVHGRHTWI